MNQAPGFHIAQSLAAIFADGLQCFPMLSGSLWLHTVTSPLDSFTVSLHSANGKQIVLGLCKEIVSGLWKMVEIPTGHVSCQSIAKEAIPTYV